MPGGEEIDTTRRSKPASLTLGDGNLLPGFEEALVGLAAGDDAQLVVPADKAFVSEWRPMCACWPVPCSKT